MALRLSDLHYPQAHASAAAPPGDCRGTEPLYAGRRLTPYPGLRGPDPVCESPPNMGPLKLPVLRPSTSLRRSRKAGAARMDAG
ncbi:hypothetical protein LNP74_33340 [Klebsiella pneumoniae subsp. pneumoniae]|nr:hypothetical protein [Klebsiella pneumoniae subsp. pneumoniae]